MFQSVEINQHAYNLPVSWKIIRCGWRRLTGCYQLSEAPSTKYALTCLLDCLIASQIIRCQHQVCKCSVEPDHALCIIAMLYCQPIGTSPWFVSPHQTTGASLMADSRGEAVELEVELWDWTHPSDQVSGSVHTIARSQSAACITAYNWQNHLHLKVPHGSTFLLQSGGRWRMPQAPKQTTVLSFQQSLSYYSVCGTSHLTNIRSWSLSKNLTSTLHITLHYIPDVYHGRFWHNHLHPANYVAASIYHTQNTFSEMCIISDPKWPSCKIWIVYKSLHRRLKGTNKSKITRHKIEGSWDACPLQVCLHNTCA